jgi:hypothetical protein
MRDPGRRPECGWNLRGVRGKALASAAGQLVKPGAEHEAAERGEAPVTSELAAGPVERGARGAELMEQECAATEAHALLPQDTGSPTSNSAMAVAMSQNGPNAVSSMRAAESR